MSSVQLCGTGHLVSVLLPRSAAICRDPAPAPTAATLGPGRPGSPLADAILCQLQLLSSRWGWGPNPRPSGQRPNPLPRPWYCLVAERMSLDVAAPGLTPSGARGGPAGHDETSQWHGVALRTKVMQEDLLPYGCGIGFFSHCG
eukprot:s2308_g12.t1